MSPVPEEAMVEESMDKGALLTEKVQQLTPSPPFARDLPALIQSPTTLMHTQTSFRVRSLPRSNFADWWQIVCGAKG